LTGERGGFQTGAMSTSPDPETPRLDIDLDRRVFDMVSSTASRVDPDSPTRFTYYEADGVLWGDYAGDTVDVGRFCGTREQDTIDISFVHRGRSGDVVRGSAQSRIERDDAGILTLVEDFVAPDGSPAVSVCREVQDR
jgi:hypothetical protein